MTRLKEGIIDSLMGILLKYKAFLLAYVLISTICSLSAQSHEFAQTSIKPPLQWKYGWRDEGRANTIGTFRKNDPMPAASGTIGSGYSPSQIAHAYGFDLISTNGNGVGQTIAIIVAFGSPTLQQDLNAFCTQYSLPSTNVPIVYPSGKPRRSDSGWASETSLDVEWAHAMAPGASIVVVVSADDSINSLLASVNYAVTNVKASVVSMSWGTPEFYGDRAYDSTFNNSSTAFVAAAGDNGAEVDWPACSQYVLGVGGTSLKCTTNGTITSESGWGGSGGGVSATENLPAFQAGWNVNSGRGVPDVSYVADPYTGVEVYCNGSWQVLGGTSLGTPQWAALLARRGSLGNPLNASFGNVLYGNASGSYATDLRDITSGNNGYPCVTGYDLVTGLGSPVANQIVVMAQTPPHVAPTPPPTPSPTPAPISRNPWGWGWNPWSRR